ncbi:hypothetical protein K466DRAFT_592081 [Polyporus arcularius HHB13444]|uniref:Uncharacterized protein n=1 Tax=Polyporus arcularius HHB13444 TaxID=1314778 RepID=A0A5C3NTY2_9APHY|nr:hypothetical protein K466DRAFT_592081 [Polyporus arcularius HHB13444]
MTVPGPERYVAMLSQPSLLVKQPRYVYRRACHPPPASSCRRLTRGPPRCSRVVETQGIQRRLLCVQLSMPTR